MIEIEKDFPRTYRRGIITYKAKSVLPITEERAVNKQREDGYDPMGYGFYKFQTWEKEGIYYAKWYCSNSSD